MGRGRSSTWVLRCAVVALWAAASACAKQPPKAVPSVPIPLEMPVPPPRVLAPVPPAEAPIAQVEPASTEPPRPVRPRTPPRTTGADARPTGARPDTPADPSEAPAAGASRPSAETAAPAPGLRTPQTANDLAAEKKVRDVLARALRGLEGISRAVLTADAQAQYDTARSFVDQATDALKVRNTMFAAYLADKAEQLTRGLAGR